MLQGLEDKQPSVIQEHLPPSQGTLTLELFAFLEQKHSYSLPLGFRTRAITWARSHQWINSVHSLNNACHFMHYGMSGICILSCLARNGYRARKSRTFQETLYKICSSAKDLLNQGICKQKGIKRETKQTPHSSSVDIMYLTVHTLT